MSAISGSRILPRWGVGTWARQTALPSRPRLDAGIRTDISEHRSSHETVKIAVEVKGRKKIAHSYTWLWAMSSLLHGLAKQARADELMAKIGT